MATYSAALLSGSTSGRPIPVAATATPGTLLHTAVAGAVSFDEVYTWASNVTATAATLTVEWGGVLAPGDHIVETMTIPAYSQMIPVTTGQRINGTLIVRAYSGTASAINITGFINRIV